MSIFSTTASYDLTLRTPAAWRVVHTGVTIEETEIDGNCLRIKFSASGCNGGTWKLRLVAAEQVKYSLPPQRDVRLILENNELCQAHLTRELTFDISDLRSNGEFTLLNVINSEQQLRYNH